MIATVRRLLIPLPFLVLAGCQTLHADLTDAEMEKRVRAHFEPGMSSAETEKRLYSMNWIEQIEKVNEGELQAIIWPHKFLGVVGGILDYYGREFLVFHFGNDDALDQVVFRPGDSSSRKDRGELVVEIRKAIP
jgi:hypothetical protein